MISEALEHMKGGLEAFGRFVPKALVRQLISNGGRVVAGGEKRNLTVMFSDIRGFTTISDELSAEFLTGHLSDYMSELSHLIEENHGTIDKFIGDAIMAFWGAPSVDLEHAENACLSLLFCRSKLHELNQMWKMRGKPEMFTRFGLSTGEVIVGNFGSEDRLNYTIIGATVNLAARLEKLNKKYGTEILVSESVLFAVGSRFIFRPVDYVVVRGKTNSCMVYELMGENKDGKHFPIQDEQLVLKGLTELAFTLFRQGHWERSLKSWQHVHKLYPNDNLAKIYIERCHEFIKNPPQDWDGITRLGED
jgi:adenylate cyclase